MFFLFYCSEFAQGIGKSVPEIETKTNEQLLRRAAATIAAHIGFECQCLLLQLLFYMT
jgi:hypothetical protein